MRTLLVLILAIPFNAYSLTLHTELECLGKKVAPVITVPEGTWAEIAQDDLHLRLWARGTADDGVKIKTEIARVAGTEIEILGTPSVMTKWGSPAQVEVMKEDGSLVYRLKVTPSL